jgi:hypothetical protein
MLETFTMILQYDNGIEFFKKCGIVPRMNEMLKNPTGLFDEFWVKRINYL